MNTESNTKQQVHKTHLDERCRSQTKQRGRGAGRRGRVGIKKPTQKNPKKNHLKKPTKSGFFRVFLNTLSRADTFIRRKRLISKSDYNLKSGCTKKYS